MEDSLHVVQKELGKTEREKRRMERRRQLNLPIYSVGEEVFSSVTHGAGALLAAAALVCLLVFSPHTPLNVVSLSIYGGTMFLLYTVSTLYHALGITKAKKVFQILDHCTIFLLIAGTYTPVLLLGIGGLLGWAFFVAIWAAAALGIVLNAVDMNRFKKLSLVSYICMGWSAVLVMRPLFDRLTILEMVFLLAGGVFYTVGAVLYGKGGKIPYMHSVWHLFVLAGSASHFLLIWQLAV